MDVIRRSAPTRDGGYVYGRGTVDDKDNVAASLMVMLMLKRLNVPLDRDVIFLAEAGEEGSTRVGIQFMVNQHFAAIDAEYCLAEGGSVTRTGGKRAVRVGADAREDSVRDRVDRARLGRPRVGAARDERRRASGGGRRRRRQVAAADAAERDDQRVLQAAGRHLPARRSRSAIATVLDPEKIAAAVDEYFREHEPRHASMLRTSVSPNIIQAGYRINVIPSEATATLDVRALPGREHARRSSRRSGRS